MKILHVVSNYHPAHGGPQYTMKHLSEKMVNWHKDFVTVVTSNSLYGPEQIVFEGIEIKEEIINNVLVKRFPLKRWHYKLIDFSGRIYRRLFKKPLPHRFRKYRWEMDSPGVLREMKKTNAEVIMATTISYLFSDYPFWRFSTKNPKPFILYGALHLHINWPKDSPMIKRAKACDCYISNTDYEKNRLIEYGVDAEKIVTIGTGISIDDMLCEPDEIQHFKKLHGIEENDIVIGHIGRLSKGKGTGILLDAFKILCKERKNVKLLLAGTTTEYADVLKEKAKQYNLPVIFLEDFNESLKPVLFNVLDIFVLASTGESFGVVFLEAWACKKPVIGANVGAVASLISNGNEGLLFEKDNPESLYNKINLLVEDERKRYELGKCGYNKIQQLFTWEVIVKKYRDAYKIAIENFNKIYKGNL